MSQVGSPSTSAPEVVYGRPYGHRADLWSAGAVMFTMLAARRPFEGTSYAQMTRSEGVLDLSGQVWDGFSEASKGLLAALMQRQAEKRPTAEDALDHSWFNEYPQAALMRGRTTA